MPVSVEFIKKLEDIPSELRGILISLLEEVERQREETVTKREFLEFAKRTEENFQRVWEAIEELTKAQRKTEQRISELAEAQKEMQKEVSRLDRALQELAEAQKKTEQRLNELAEAQKKTEEEIRKLSTSLRRTRQEVGGLAKSVAYALENEAFVKLPEFLKKNFGIQIRERFIRTEIKGEEINLFAKGKRNGRDVVIIGESVLKLDDVAKLRTIQDKVEAVIDEVEAEVVPIIVTHFAKKKVLEKADRRGIIVVQSFQW